MFLFFSTIPCGFKEIILSVNQHCARKYINLMNQTLNNLFMSVLKPDLFYCLVYPVNEINILVNSNSFFDDVSAMVHGIFGHIQ